MASESFENLDTSPTERFEVNDPAWLEFFREYGYVVLANVANEENIAHAKELCISWLERLWADMGEDSQFRFSDIETYHTIPISSSNGIVGSAGAGQTDFSWYCRLLPKVREAFEMLWETDDLICSYDGFNIFRPWQIDGYEGWKTKGGWFHVDQNPFEKSGTGNGFQCVQGLLNLYPCTEETGGLTVIPKTHTNHEEYCGKVFPENFRLTTGHYVPLPRDEAGYTGRPRLVTSAAGDLCLWDSRTIHCNSPGIGLAHPPTRENLDFIRLTCYICMTPTAKADKKVLKDRWEAWNKHTGSTHWPHMWFPRECHHYVEREETTRTPAVKRLIRGNTPIKQESTCCTVL